MRQICFVIIHHGDMLTLYHTVPTFNDLETDNWQPAFSSFPTMFSGLSKKEITI